MTEGFFSRGFTGRRRQSDNARLPPGQYVEEGFPVLSAGPTPRTPLERWHFKVVGEIDGPRRWTWEEFRALPSEVRGLGTVLRCPSCDNPLMRLARIRGRLLVDLGGTSHLDTG